jgi:hypothetical protein
LIAAGTTILERPPGEFGAGMRTRNRASREVGEFAQ